jgi:hypothetical protein
MPSAAVFTLYWELRPADLDFGWFGFLFYHLVLSLVATLFQSYHAVVFILEYRQTKCCIILFLLWFLLRFTSKLKWVVVYEIIAFKTHLRITFKRIRSLFRNYWVNTVYSLRLTLVSRCWNSLLSLRPNDIQIIDDVVVCCTLLLVLFLF